MAIENETADQVVRMILQGSEVVLKLSGEAAMRIASVIYNALKGDLTTKGKATLWEFLKSGRDQKLFTIPDEYLKAFTRASKKFGFPFVVLKDKSNTGMTDIMVYAGDASKVNRVLEDLRLTIEPVKTLTPEVKTPSGELFMPLDIRYSVPLELIDGIPETPKHDKRLLSELQKYAAKMKQMGPQVVEPVGLLCKSDGRYEVLPGQGSKRLMALRLAGYKEAVADILVPKLEGIDVRAENVDKQPRERTDTPKLPFDFDPPEKESPTKEDGQTVNPTMARTSRNPASGQDLGKNSKKRESVIPSDDPEMRPSVKEKLEECRKISVERQASRNLMKQMRKYAPKKSDMR